MLPSHGLYKNRQRPNRQPAASLESSCHSLDLALGRSARVLRWMWIVTEPLSSCKAKGNEVLRLSILLQVLISCCFPGARSCSDESRHFFPGSGALSLREWSARPLGAHHAGLGYGSLQLLRVSSPATQKHEKMCFLVCK